MPKIERTQLRFNSRGIDLAHPVDRMAEGAYPYLQNIRSIVEGRIESRPGYTKAIGPDGSTILGGFATPLHSTRRLNDIDLSHAPNGYAWITGGATNLYKDTALIDTGYSGDPLSLLIFRPETSSEHWMYVYDANKQSKVLPDGTVRAIGVAPPQAPIYVEYGTPAWIELDNGQSNSGWVAGGTIPFYAIDTINREGTGVTSTIQDILYVDGGAPGWTCIVPTSTNPSWLGTGERMQVKLTAETVVVREIHAAIVATTVRGISYDAGSTGACSIVLDGNPADIDRNSLIRINGELIRVLSVTKTPDLVGSSIRCNTTGTVNISDAVTGALSWFVYTQDTHTAGESITSNCVYGRGDTIPSGSTATPSMSRLISLDASKAMGRPISLADDYMHISLWLTNAPGVGIVRIKIDIDPATTNLSNAFKNNYLLFELLPADIFGVGGTPTLGNWFELNIPLAQATRVGLAENANLSTIKALQIQTDLTIQGDVAFDWWYLFGTYGPTIQPNAPTGYAYSTRNRDSNTGAYSVPGPDARHQMFPLREQISIAPDASSQAGIDSNDIFRRGGAETNATYVGSIANGSFPFDDSFSSIALEGNAQADLTALQPWPILQKPRSGFVNVTGTSVEYVSGSLFDLALLAATVIKINGYNYQTYGQPSSPTRLQITQSGGVQSNVPYEIDSPTLAGQPLPYAFGPLEGPFAPVAFALGDTENAGTLYHTNNSNLDTASDANTIDLCPPSEPLISGQAWNGIALVGSRDNLYQIRYSFTDTAPFYQFKQIPALSGIWSRWASCKGPDGMYYLGRDAIYKATDQGADIACRNEDGTDPLYPLFPHDGKPAVAITIGNDVVYPIDMSLLNRLRLTCADQTIYFDYVDINGAQITLKLEILLKRWTLHKYAAACSVHYLIEETVNNPTSAQIVQLGRDSGIIYLEGGNVDDDTVITSRIYTPALDLGDERLQKLYVDAMTDADQTGSLSFYLTFNDIQILSTEAVLSLTAPGRKQLLTNFATLGDIRLYRNVGGMYSWTGGPSGPRLYAFEPSGYVQPYVSTSLVTQVITLGDADWKHHRRLYAAYISNGTVNFNILCQDGRTFGPYTLPSTAGKFRVIPVMLDHGIKDLAFGYQLLAVDQSQSFALFPNDFTIETKSWMAEQYIKAAVFAA